MRRYDEEIEEISMQMLKETGGMFLVMPSPPTALFPIIPKSLWHYWGMTKSSQRVLQRAHLIRGRYGMYVFQSSHGRQQIKLYQPWIYKNEVNTPLRIRSRKIMQLASQEPQELRNKKVRELYRSFPYQLLKSEPVKLRMKNFYLDKSVMKGDMISVYRAIDGENPHPESDPLYCRKEYGEKRTVKFAYEEDEEQHYYAVNERNGGMSNVLHFMWKEKIEFTPKSDKQPDKWVEAAKLFNSGQTLEEQPQISFGKSKFAQSFYQSRQKKANEGQMTNIKTEDFTTYLRRLGHYYYYYEKMKRKHQKLEKAGFFTG